MPKIGDRPITHEELIRRLRARSVLIVHFSHHANMREGGVFPADLHAAALNSRLWPLSCCLVWPTHAMSLPGSVGLVLRPRNIASIVGVASSDAGYSTLPDGVQLGGGAPLDEEALDRSFDVPPGAGYNEWRVRESDVVGVYVEFVDNMLQAKKHTVIEDGDTGMPIGHDIVVQPITLDEVHKAFPDLPIYTRTDGKIVATCIPGSVIYPW